MRFAVCPLAPGCLWWEGLGHSQHVKHVSQPVKRFKTFNGARNFAEKKANDYNHGLVVVDTGGHPKPMVWDDGWLPISDTGDWGKDD